MTDRELLELAAKAAGIVLEFEEATGRYFYRKSPYDLVHNGNSLKTYAQDIYPPLERFAELVAAAEREKIAHWMIQRSYATGHGDTTEDLLSELEWQVRESEREAILKKADSLGWVSVDDIRARGE